MRFTDDFEKKEWLGRQALKELQKIYPEYFKWDIHFTEGKYDDYDAYYFIVDENQNIKKRVWVEIKIRDLEYDSYILEKKKLNQLIKKRDSMFLTKDDVEFLYLNYTPSKTIIWNITNIKDEKKADRKMMNKATSISRDEKSNKEIYYLNQKEGKILNYILNEKHLLKDYDDYLLNKLKKEIKKKPGLEDILFG